MFFFFQSAFTFPWSPNDSLGSGVHEMHLVLSCLWGLTDHISMTVGQLNSSFFLCLDGYKLHFLPFLLFFSAPSLPNSQQLYFLSSVKSDQGGIKSGRKVLTFIKGWRNQSVHQYLWS